MFIPLPPAPGPPLSGHPSHFKGDPVYQVGGGPLATLMGLEIKRTPPLDVDGGPHLEGGLRAKKFNRLHLVRCVVLSVGCQNMTDLRLSFAVVLGSLPLDHLVNFPGNRDVEGYFAFLFFLCCRLWFVHLRRWGELLAERTGVSIDIYMIATTKYIKSTF
jgi:hypothetical protein